MSDPSLPVLGLDGPKGNSAGVRPTTPVVCSVWSVRSQAHRTRCLEHLVVVRDEHAEVGAELVCGREVNCVQRAHIMRMQHSGCVEYPSVEADELNARQHVAGSRHAFVAFEEHGAEYLSSSQRARHQWATSTQVPAQRRRLRFVDHQLHERR